MDSNPEKKRPVGRPPYEPNDFDAGQFKLALAFGIPQNSLEQYIGKDIDTLKKHYPEIWNATKADPTLMVTWALFQNCMSGNVAAQIFWTKMRNPDFQENKAPDDSNADALLKHIANKLSQ